MAQRKQAVAKLNAAKAKTPFGKLISKSKTYTQLSNTIKSGEMSQIIKASNPLKIAKNLGSDGMAIYNYLKDGNKTYQAIKQFGYDNTMEVLKVLYALGQTEKMV